MDFLFFDPLGLRDTAALVVAVAWELRLVLAALALLVLGALYAEVLSLLKLERHDNRVLLDALAEAREDADYWRQLALRGRRPSEIVRLPARRTPGRVR